MQFANSCKIGRNERHSEGEENEANAGVAELDQMVVGLAGGELFRGGRSMAMAESANPTAAVRKEGTGRELGSPRTQLRGQGGRRRLGAAGIGATGLGRSRGRRGRGGVRSEERRVGKECRL